MMRVVYIHGATATERKFAYIQKNINVKNPIYINYNSKDANAQENLEFLKETLREQMRPNDKLFYIMHSLGGIYGIYLQEEFPYNSSQAVSLATPFGGSEVAQWGRWFAPQYQLFADIVPTSRFISNSRKIKISIPWKQVITTTGDVPLIAGKNDGIVTMESMMCRDDVDYYAIDRNHYEIVQSKRTVSLISDCLKGIQR